MNIFIKERKILLVLCSVFFYPSIAQALHIYGYVEKVRFEPSNSIVKAKLDTGAVSASLSAINIKIIKKNNKSWVSFDIPQPLGSIHLERKLLRYVLIKKRRSEMKKEPITTSTKRPVVKIELTLGCETKNIDVNLTNRQAFNYPLLLGRKSLILFNVAVNPALTFVSKLKEHGCLSNRII